jgi:uncharacterized membrane protein YeaQ/YmgE (transglycosylase-associated protein family)
MSLVMFALWVFAGLLAGLVAGFVVNRGGYGLRWDIVLGLVGSIVGGAIYRALGIPPDAGMVSTVHRRDSRSGRGDRWSAHDVAYCR